MNNLPVLDPCCGTRMWWFDKQNPNVIFGDIRTEQITVKDSSMRNQERILSIAPDYEMDFTNLPFSDESFYIVAFDPPHLTRAGKSWMFYKYGKLEKSWREDLKKGFEECFRVLRPGGTLVFKWSEVNIGISEILKLSPVPPLFGSRAGKAAKTHWVVFMKPVEKKLN